MIKEMLDVVALKVLGLMVNVILITMQMVTMEVVMALNQVRLAMILGLVLMPVLGLALETNTPFGRILR